MFWVVVALFYFVLAAVAPSILGLFVNRARPDFRSLSLSLRVIRARPSSRPGRTFSLDLEPVDPTRDRDDPTPNSPPQLGGSR